MVQIADSEKKILQEWVPGIDLSKVNIRTGFVAEALCTVLNAWAVTLGYNIFISKVSPIAEYPSGHPLRMGLLVHELYHVKDEKKRGVALFLLQYNFVAIKLGLRAMVGRRIFRWKKILHFVAYNHPLEKPAFEVAQKFLEKHWTEEEAKKWGWKPENER